MVTDLMTEKFADCTSQNKGIAAKLDDAAVRLDPQKTEAMSAYKQHREQAAPVRPTSPPPPPPSAANAAPVRPTSPPPPPPSAGQNQARARTSRRT